MPRASPRVSRHHKIAFSFKYLRANDPDNERGRKRKARRGTKILRRPRLGLRAAHNLTTLGESKRRRSPGSQPPETLHVASGELEAAAAT